MQKLKTKMQNGTNKQSIVDIVQTDIQKQNSILIDKNELNTIVVVNPKRPRTPVFSVKLMSSKRWMKGFYFEKALFLLSDINKTLRQARKFLQKSFRVFNAFYLCHIFAVHPVVMRPLWSSPRDNLEVPFLQAYRGLSPPCR